MNESITIVTASTRANDYGRGLLNGSLWKVVAADERGEITTPSFSRAILIL
jgi:hypothetical protein